MQLNLPLLLSRLQYIRIIHWMLRHINEIKDKVKQSSRLDMITDVQPRATKHQRDWSKMQHLMCFLVKSSFQKIRLPSGEDQALQMLISYSICAENALNVLIYLHAHPSSLRSTGAVWENPDTTLTGEKTSETISNSLLIPLKWVDIYSASQRHIFCVS